MVDGQMTVRDAALQPSATYALTGTVTGAGAERAAGGHRSRRGATTTASSSARPQTDPVTGALQPDPGLVGLRREGDRRRATCPVTQPVTLTGPAVLDFQLAPAGSVVLVVTDGATTRIAGDLAALGYSVVSETAASTTPASWPAYNLLVWSAGAERVTGGPGRASAARSSRTWPRAGSSSSKGARSGYDACSSPGYPTFRDNVLHVTQWKTDNAGALTALRPDPSDRDDAECAAGELRR